MKALRAFMLLLAALLVCAPAAAESQGDTLDPEAILDAVDISELEKASQQQGVDAKAMILSLATGESAWDLSALLEALRKDALEALTQAMAMVAALLAPALLSALARQLAGEARGAQVVSQLAYLVCAAQLADIISSMTPTLESSEVSL